MGLVYDWDALIEVLKRLPMIFDPEYYVLGRSLKLEDFVLNPGGMGTGFIAAEDISKMHDELVGLKKDFSNHVLPLPQDVFVALTQTELEEAYNDLIELYDSAIKKQHGLLMTF